MGQINTYCLRKCKLPHIYTQDDGKCLWKLNALRTIPIYSVGVIVRICKMTYYETTNSYETIALSSIDGRLVKYSICYTSVIKYHIAVEWILIGTLCINIKIPLSKTFLIKWEKSSVQNILYRTPPLVYNQRKIMLIFAYLCISIFGNAKIRWWEGKLDDRKWYRLFSACLFIFSAFESCEWISCLKNQI